MDDPLDFEAEDQLLAVPPPTTKRRRVIGLDDLLTDFYTERDKHDKKKSKVSKVPKGYNSDEEDKKARENERVINKLVDECQKQVMITEDEMPLWGLTVFGPQKRRPSLNIMGLENCKLLQTLTNTELKSILDLNFEQGESFWEELLMNGWLSKLAFVCGSVDEPIASWTFHKLLYSSNEELQISACEFWCRILVSENKVDQPFVRLGWFPRYSQFKDALGIYGYLSDTSDNCSTTSKSDHTDDECDGPPQNIISWIKVLSTCCRIRNVNSLFSTSEVEDLLGVLISISLDRQLQGLSFILHECMQSAIGFFSESEWDMSCKKIANAAACRVPKDLNCVRVVECISGDSKRIKHLRSQVALQILIACFDGKGVRRTTEVGYGLQWWKKKVTTIKELVEFLVSINLKDADCDFSQLYIYLVLAENCLSSYCSIEERAVLLEMWYKYLRNCSTQIKVRDLRFYAAKVRNKASYILQNSCQRSCQ